MSADPAMGEYVTADRDNAPAGGVFNPLNLQTYHYAGNNPLKYTDPSGKIIVLNNTNIEDRQVLVDDINSMSVKQYKLGKDGKTLVVDHLATFRMRMKIFSGKETRSQSFTNDIERMRKSERTVYIRIAEEGRENNVGMDRPWTDDELMRISGNGMTIRFMDGSIQIIVGRDGTPFNGWIYDKEGISMDVSRRETLLHELSGHAARNIEHDRDPTKGSEINAIEEENKVRRELRLPRERREDDHPAYSGGENSGKVQE